MFAVILERPVGWRGNYQVNAIGRQEINLPRIMVVQIVRRGNLGKPGLDSGNCLGILGDSWQIRLVVGDFADFGRDPIGGIKCFRLRSFSDAIFILNGGFHNADILERCPGGVTRL
ncbi:MAG: hypothetical protein A2809_01575 [Candidatus Muproteobacteria bacterium RIFCSPHIGHO2_01_FULL_61_200]|nr:MAG: hypothetical protein A2809_01575 [Candidatus Muproteobacteria bacterium RIFCSPHIGHO2_01_FULL_61_200]